MEAGIYNLCDETITTAGTVTVDEVDSLEGMTAATVQMRFAYGSGGTSVKAYLQTSIDQGTTWIDVACVVFGTASETKVFNLQADAQAAIDPSNGALADDTLQQGILGDMLRIKYTSVGTYAGNTLLSVRVHAR